MGPCLCGDPSCWSCGQAMGAPSCEWSRERCGDPLCDCAASTRHHGEVRPNKRYRIRCLKEEEEIALLYYEDGVEYDTLFFSINNHDTGREIIEEIEYHER